VEAVRCPSNFAVGPFARNLLQSGTTRGSAVESRLKHLSASLSSTRTTPRVTFAPLAPVRRHNTVYGCTHNKKYLIHSLQYVHCRHSITWSASIKQILEGSIFRRHSYSSKPIRIVVNLNPNPNLDLWSFNPKTITLPKVFSYTKLEHFGIFVFQLRCRQ